MKKGRVAIFLSGRGSNFVAIYNSSLKTDSNFKIVVVISDKKEAPGLEKAREFNIPAFYISPKKFDTKKDYEKYLVRVLNEKSVDLICLAGFMRIVGEELLNKFHDRIMNIHPALLPSFPGLHAQKQAFDYGVKISGCTVHFVDSGVDTGPIILQKAVEVKKNDTDDKLSQRILSEEHKLYSKAIRLFFNKSLKISGRKVTILEK